MEDALASNGPHLQLLQELDRRFILGVKPGDPQALLAEVDRGERLGHVARREVTDEPGVIHRFRFINALPLNQSPPDLLINFLEYWEVHEDKVLHFSWITDFELSEVNLLALMRGDRARWEVENETFNTLKNPGYSLEHNYGHGRPSSTGIRLISCNPIPPSQGFWVRWFGCSRHFSPVADPDLASVWQGRGSV